MKKTKETKRIALTVTLTFDKKLQEVAEYDEKYVTELCLEFVEQGLKKRRRQLGLI